MDPASWSSVGGDVDVYRLLQRLATQRDADEFVLVGRNSGHDPKTVGFPSNVVNPYFEQPEMTAAMRAAGQLDDRPPGKGVRRERNLTDIVKVNTGLIWPWFHDLDAVIMWLGQHGTLNTPITPIGEFPPALAQPLISAANYAGYLVAAVNEWQRRKRHPDQPYTLRGDNNPREVIWLCPDPRNYLKARDLRDPLTHPILGQFDWQRDTKYFRPGDAECNVGDWDGINGTQHSWVSPTHYVYSGLELTAIDRDRVRHKVPHERAASFGMIINENAPGGSAPRLDVLKEWVLPWCPDVELFGKWREPSVKALGRDRIDTVPVTEVDATMQRWRCTFTTPASSSGWATSKPWEAFANGTVCFFHPGYDTQDHILGRDHELRRWLRVESPEQLERRVRWLDDHPSDWEWIVTRQWRLLLHTLAEDKIGRMIHDRLQLQ